MKLKITFILAVLLAIAFVAIPALAMSGNQFGDSPGISATDPATGLAIGTMKHVGDLAKPDGSGAMAQATNYLMLSVKADSTHAGTSPQEVRAHPGCISTGGGGYCSHLKMI